MPDSPFALNAHAFPDGQGVPPDSPGRHAQKQREWAWDRVFRFRAAPSVLFASNAHALPDGQGGWVARPEATRMGVGLRVPLPSGTECTVRVQRPRPSRWSGRLGGTPRSNADGRGTACSISQQHRGHCSRQTPTPFPMVRACHPTASAMQIPYLHAAVRIRYDEGGSAFVDGLSSRDDLGKRRKTHGQWALESG
jgi:hypothetical protein